MSRKPPTTIFMMDLLATVPYYTAYLSRALLAAGADVTVGSISYYLDPHCFRGRGLSLHPGALDLVSRLPLSSTPRRVLKLAEAFLNMAALTLRFLVHPPAVVHVQYLPLLRRKLPVERWFLRFCRFRKASIVLTVHDLLPHDTADRYRETFADLYSGVDRLICHSEAIRARLAAEFAIPPARIAVIPHGPFFYDLPATGQNHALRGFDLDPGKVLVLWQGILFPYKGVDLLLRAWQTVEANTSAARLLIAGTGSPELLADIRAQLTALKLTQVDLHLRFISSEELVALYRVAEIVVYPYRAITTSGALATGLALGKTIVASDLPVFREILTDRENALLVPPGSPPELAHALLELIQTASLREQLAAKIRQMNFGDRSWSSIASQTLQAYRDAHVQADAMTERTGSTP